ncbi:hypothetical protein [Corynebacterium oculi]|nr:hypothetical protein [Corynebacterium oculi]
MEPWMDREQVLLSGAEAHEFDHMMGIFEVPEEHLLDASVLLRVYAG